MGLVIVCNKIKVKYSFLVHTILDKDKPIAYFKIK